MMLAAFPEDQDISFDELFSAIYDIDERPFYFAGLTFAQLAQHVQHFLLRNGFVVDQDADQSGLSLEELHHHFNRLLHVRQAELSALESNTNGIHRAIVSEMLSLSSNGSSESMTKLRDVLIPGWRGHLDECLDRIDALIWFEIEMRRGSAYEMKPEVYLRDRLEDVKNMILFVVQHLQLTKERMEKERNAEKHLVQIETGADELEEEGDSDATYVDENSPGGFTSIATSDNEEYLLSENDFPVKNDISWDSDSETKSYFRDLNLSRLSSKT